jgi:hypothetical protein
VSAGVCKKNGSKYDVLLNRVRVGSELIRAQHHINWRLKGLDKIKRKDVPDFYFSVPMVISAKDKDLIRTLLVDLLNNVDSVIENSPSEELMCLNIDWFGF